MELLPKDIEETIPPLDSQGSVLEPLAIVKLFDPRSRFSFFVLEAQREPKGDLRLFGYCRSPLGQDFDAFGYTSLRELQSVRGLGLGLERDVHFPPTPITMIVPEVGYPSYLNSDA